MSLLPKPFIDHIPKLLKENISTTGQAMCDKIDLNIDEWLKEIILSGHYYSVDRCPESLLDDLGYLLNAGILNEDTPRQKRVKILNAIPSHKRRYLFSTIKVVIDSICGGNSTLYSVQNTDDWIMLGKTVDDPDYYWGTMGTDGVDDDLGLWLIGDFSEPVIQGNIYINVDNNSLSLDDQLKLYNEMLNYVSVYLKVYFGYVSSGVFINYFTIG